MSRGLAKEEPLDAVSRIEHAASNVANPPEENEGDFLGQMSTEMLNLLFAVKALGDRPDAPRGDGAIAEMIAPFVPGHASLLPEELKALRDEDGSGFGPLDLGDDGERVPIVESESPELGSLAD